MKNQSNAHLVRIETKNSKYCKYSIYNQFSNEIALYKNDKFPIRPNVQLNMNIKLKKRKYNLIIIT